MKLSYLQYRLHKLLEEKTSWGRNDLKTRIDALLISLADEIEVYADKEKLEPTNDNEEQQQETPVHRYTASSKRLKAPWN